MRPAWGFRSGIPAWGVVLKLGEPGAVWACRRQGKVERQARAGYAVAGGN